VPQADYQPYLFSIQKEQMPRGAINPLSFLFNPAPPQLGLTPVEQRVLAFALLNASDAEIAARAGVSVDAVKKTWRQTYNRVALKMPYLIPASDHATPSGSRTVEKRRHLLEYVRTHLEELRPFKQHRRKSVVTVVPSR
jgi:hypothetical protein